MEALENPMVSGIYPYNAPFEDKPDFVCDSCGAWMYRGEDVFDWGRNWVCRDCVEQYVRDLTGSEDAEIDGEIDALGIASMTI